MIKDSIRRKIEACVERHEELGQLLSRPEVIQDQNKFRQFSKEYAELQALSEAFGDYVALERDQAAAESMLTETDLELRRLAQDELEAMKTQFSDLEAQLYRCLLPKDPHDQRNVFLEIRAGTGGDEAALFSGDLFRMYTRFAESQGWRVELISDSAGEKGGYKEVILRILGQQVYGKLKFESGAHRVQRVPETESQGRVHTSACTVAVLPEVETIEAIDINPNDLRIDTIGPLGLAVNT